MRTETIERIFAIIAAIVWYWLMFPYMKDYMW